MQRLLVVVVSFAATQHTKLELARKRVAKVARRSAAVVIVATALTLVLALAPKLALATIASTHSDGTLAAAHARQQTRDANVFRSHRVARRRLDNQRCARGANKTAARP